MTDPSTHPADRRLLLVHAHPDDETITTGATMARYAAEGAAVTLVTCTRGERGEVIGAELAHLAGDGPALAAHRTGELASAMAALGVSDHRFLGQDATGADGRPVMYVDSGMVWGSEGLAVAPPDMPPNAFAAVPVDEAATHLARVLRDVRPQVVVTYEPGGGYGHPDHVRAHDVTMRAVELAADKGLELPGRHGNLPWQVAKLYWVVAPRSIHTRAVRALADRGFVVRDQQASPMTMLVPDEEVTCRVDAEVYRPTKAAALRAHATQVVVAPDETAFALSNEVWQPLSATEFFRLAVGRPDTAVGALREDDLFAGAAGDHRQAALLAPGPAAGHTGGPRTAARTSPPLLALGVVSALVAGGLAGLSGVVWHHVPWLMGSLRFPFGLVVTVAFLAALSLCVGLASRRSRLPLLALVVGWAAAVMAGGVRGPGNDVLMTTDAYGLAYTVASAVGIVLWGVVVPRIWSRASRRGAGTPGAL